METHNPYLSTFVHKRLFAELNGFVLCDPQRLVQFHGENIHHDNLLRQYTETEDGDKVCIQGIVIPVLDVEPEYYTLVVRYASSPAYLNSAPLISNHGFVLGTETGKLLLCGLGYLTNWNLADDLEHYVSLMVIPGWYSVEVKGGIQVSSENKENEYIYEFILTPSEKQTALTASINLSMNLWQEQQE